MAFRELECIKASKFEPSLTLLLCHVFMARNFALAVPFSTLVFVYALFYICHISSDTFPFGKLFSWD